ncbi:34481_t:CDS:2, partial [Racocetra persica]
EKTLFEKLSLKFTLPLACTHNISIGHLRIILALRNPNKCP